MDCQNPVLRGQPRSEDVGALLLANKSLASKVIYTVDAPGVVAFMRFVPEVAETSQVFASFATGAVILTLVRLDDGTWRAWGLGPGMRSARAVLGEH